MEFNQEEVLKFYEELPNETTLKFSEKITNYVVENINQFYNEEFIKFLKEQLDNSIQNSKGFPYFYTLVVFYRRMRSNTELNKLIENYREFFEGKPLFLFTESSYELNKNTKQSYMQSLNKAERCIEIITKENNNYDPEYTGFYNHYASIIASFLEQNYTVSEYKKELAYQYIEKCIKKNSNHATYYITLARLELNDKNFYDAREHILYAIDVEKDRGRISEYNDLLLKVEYKQTINELVKKSDEISMLVNESKTNILEYLAFFSGIIAFLISSGNIAVNNPNIAIKLILVMLGALLIGFSSFTILIQNDNKKVMSKIFVILIGMALITLSNFWV